VINPIVFPSISQQQTGYAEDIGRRGRDSGSGLEAGALTTNTCKGALNRQNRIITPILYTQPCVVCNRFIRLV